VIREAKEEDKKIFNLKARHPLQSWEWGEFRKKTGVEVSRLIAEDNKKVKDVFQITWHKIPHTNWTIGYCPKSNIPTVADLKEIRELALRRKAVFVKFEPNIVASEINVEKIESLGSTFDFRSGKPLFTKYTFVLDISKDEKQILESMNQKTRYNIRLAEKKGVKIYEDNSMNGFEKYWKLTEETTKRQKFYSHTKSYHKEMWKTMISAGKGSLLLADYEGKTLAAWILFVLNGILYYPYGASSGENREVMASNLMMWEAIKMGKKNNCSSFDMWGSMGPNPDTNDPWFGFHKFKQGYGGDLTEFLGSFDLVVKNNKYTFYTIAEKVRWTTLKLMAVFRK